MKAQAHDQDGLHRRKIPTGLTALGLLALSLTLAGCSIKRMAIDQVATALSESGAGFASDDDPELIKAAAPFSLKLMESLLQEVPNHEGLLFATSSGFTQYAYAFVQLEADQLEDEDFEGAQKMRDRARRLYLRARDYGLRGLEAGHRGFSGELFEAPENAVEVMTRGDVPLLYWTSVSWAAAISLSLDDANMIADLPIVESLIYKALELDPDYEDGAIHVFLISFEQARSAEGDPFERSRYHFERAMELQKGRQIGALVAYAESVCVPKQDRQNFQRLLNEALAFDAESHPEFRLVNLIMQERAAWLLSQTDSLFLD